MIPFLKQVAKEYYGRGNIERTCFVFPNRRSMVFFKKYLGAEVASAGRVGNSGTVPLLMPGTFTINDFMGRLYGGVRADRVSLLLKLYECYSALNPKAESLDDFIYWGDVLLSDFNDVDKYLVDPGQLFTNVSDFKALQDTFSYLTDRQRAALEHFSSHFRNTKGEGQGVKENFVRIWNLLHPLYVNFREALAAEGMAYEGMVYRDVAEAFLNGVAASRIETGFPRARLFVFTGLNALNECEKTVMRKMRDASLAEFCWDYSGSMSGRGNRQLVEAMEQLLIQENAAKNFLQASQDEVNILIPFNSEPIDVFMAAGNGSELEGLYERVEEQTPGGGTNMYSAIVEGLDLLYSFDLSDYTPAIILLTDGQSGGSIDDIEPYYSDLGVSIPIFSIMFGDADESQLEELAEYSNARVFDGRENLTEAFRSVKGYN